MKHSEFTPHAYITLSNCGGIEIMVNHSNDGVFYRFNYGQDNLENEEIFEEEIMFSFEDGEPYFVHANSTEYSLNEAMRINR